MENSEYNGTEPSLESKITDFIYEETPVRSLEIVVQPDGTTIEFYL